MVDAGEDAAGEVADAPAEDVHAEEPVEGADAAEVSWLVQRPRALPEGALEDAGIDLDGARTAAIRLGELTRTGSMP